MGTVIFLAFLMDMVQIYEEVLWLPKKVAHQMAGNT